MTHATLSRSPVFHFPLPQEIVDLIVDQVAFASGDQVEDQSDLCGLITCTLISRPFSIRARAHLHGNIRLKVHIDKVHKRSTQLLESVQNRPDGHSIPPMQSLSLVIHDDELGSINNLSLTANRKKEQRESPSGSLSKLIQYASTLRPSLHHFSLVSRCCAREDAAHSTNPNISFRNQALCFFTNSNLRTLHLANIADVSLEKLADVFFLPHLVELALNSLTFAPAPVEGPEVAPTAAEGLNAKRPAPNLRKLEMRHIPHSRFLGYLQPLLSASNESSSPPASSLFPKLHDLTFSVNFDPDENPILASLSQMATFMERNPSTLRTLEIENYGYPGQGRHFQSSTRSRIPLIKLPALRTLKFTICNDSSLDFLKRILFDLNCGCRARPSFRGSFHSLELKVVLPAPQLSTHIAGATVCQLITSSDRLPQIDNLLASTQTAAFSNLENLKIHIILFHQASYTADTRGKAITSITECLPAIESAWRTAFEKTMASNRVDLTVDVRHVFSQDTMERYLKYACCPKDQ